jgi:hypothetical protein
MKASHDGKPSRAFNDPGVRIAFGTAVFSSSPGPSPWSWEKTAEVKGRQVMMATRSGIEQTPQPQCPTATVAAPLARNSSPPLPTALNPPTAHAGSYWLFQHVREMRRHRLAGEGNVI